MTYDLDLPQPYRAKYLMNLCLTCSPQEYLPISKTWNYTVRQARSMTSPQMGVSAVDGDQHSIVNLGLRSQDAG